MKLQNKQHRQQERETAEYTLNKESNEDEIRKSQDINVMRRETLEYVAAQQAGLATGESSKINQTD